MAVEDLRKDPLYAELSDMSNGQAAQIRNNFAQAQQVNPDQDAQHQTWGKLLQIPASSARAFPDDVKKQVAAQQLDTWDLLKKAPATAAFLQNQDNANIAHDDLHNLTKIESGVQQMTEWNPSVGERLTNWITKTMTPALNTLYGNAPEPQKQAVAEFLHQYTLGIVPNVAGEAQTTAGGIAKGAGGLAGFLKGGAMKLAEMSMGRFAPGVLEHTANEGRVAKLLRDIGGQGATLGLASGFEELGNVLNSPDLLTGAKKEGEAVASGTATGAIFGAVSRLLPADTMSQFLGRAVSNTIGTDLVSGKMPFEDIANWGQLTPEQQGQAAFNYGLNAWFSRGKFAGAHQDLMREEAKKQMDAERAVRVSDIVSQMSQISAMSELRRRDPERFRSLVNDMADGREVENVFVNANDFSQVLLQQGIDIKELAGKMPEVARQLEVGAATNGYLRIPIGDYMTHIAGTPIGDGLLQHVKVDPEGMTQGEATKYFQNQEKAFIDRLTEEGKKTLEQKANDEAFKQSADQVSKSVSDQLMATGRYSPEVAKVQGEMYKAFYTALGQRMKSPEKPEGLLPHEAMEQHQVHITSDGSGGYPQVDLNSPEFKGWFGDSKVADMQYHWTRNNFDAFEQWGTFGNHFGSQKAAEDRSFRVRARERQLSNPDEGGHVMPVWLSIKNPLKTADAGNWMDSTSVITALTASKDLPDAVKRELRQYQAELNDEKASFDESMVDVPDGERYADWMSNWTMSRENRYALEELRRIVEDAGFDGVEYRNEVEDAGKSSYIALRPEQIKSIFNRGTFDPNDPNILHQDPKDVGAEYNPADYNALPQEVKAHVDAQIDKTDHPDQVRAKLQEFSNTPWARQAISGAMARAAIDELLAGRTPQFFSVFGAPSTQKMANDILRKGEAAIWAHLDGKFIGHPEKPENAVNSSFLDCEPSLACAKYCYAATGFNYPINVAKAELVSWAIKNDPARAAKIVAREYRGMPGFEMGKALRMFDKGDGNSSWLPFLDALKAEGIRAHIFSKRPDFLRQVDPDHLRLLSIDGTNHELSDANPDLPVAYVFSGDAGEAKWINEHTDRMQLILPVVMYEKFLTRAQIGQLSPDLKSNICPVDKGVVSLKPTIDVRDKNGDIIKRIPISDKVPEPKALEKANSIAEKKDGEVVRVITDNWTCSRCDKGGGVGCYHGQTTKSIMEKLSRPLNEIPDAELESLVKEITNAIKDSRLSADERAGLLTQFRSVLDGARSGYDGRTEAANPGQLPGKPGGVEEGNGGPRGNAGQDGTLKQGSDWTTADTFDPSSPDPLKPGAGSRGTFNPATSTITLLKAADLSTFLHESGHFFLETMTKVSESSPEMAADLDKALSWMGVEGGRERWNQMSLEERRQFHEKFARGFEAYLFEGTAPNLEMKGIFQRFKSWLVDVYKSVGNLGVELNPEIRGVFDRLLATEEQVQQAEAVRSMRPLFETAEQAARYGMTPQEFADYQKEAQEGTQEAIDKMQARSLRDMKWLSNAKAGILKALQGEAKEARASIREEVEKKVAAEPIEQARTWLTKGEAKDPETGETIKTDKGFRMNEDLVNRLFPGGDLANVDLTPLNRMMAKNGIQDPDIVAKMFGFNSGVELIQKLLTEQPTHEKINQAVDQRMLEEHGEVATPEAREQAAEEAIHNEARAKFMATGLSILTKSKNTGSLILKAAKEAAGQIIGDLKVKDLKPKQYTAAEGRANKEALRLAPTDADGAAEAQRSALLNNQLSAQALKAADEVRKTITYLKRMASGKGMKSLPGEFAEQINELLGQFDLRNKVPDEMSRPEKNLVQWVTSMRDAGFEPVVPDWLAEFGGRTHWKELTIDQLRGLRDTIKSIEFIGRMEKKVTVEGKQMALDMVVGDLKERLLERGNNFTMEQIKGDAPTVDTKGYWKTFLYKLKVAMRASDADLRGQEYKINAYDMHDLAGPFRRYLFDRMMDRNYWKVDQLKRLSDEAIRLGEVLGKEWQRSLYDLVPNDRLMDPDLGGPMEISRGKMLRIASHVGNESNFDKLCKGWDWKPEDVMHFLMTHMTEKDWIATQAHWDAFDPLWEESVQMVRRMGGVPPPKIPPREFDVDVNGKTMHIRGGYSPIDYDPKRSKLAARKGEFNLEAGEKVGADMVYRATTTSNGSLNSRVDGYTDRVALDFHGVESRLRDTVHDLAYREVLIDAKKILNDSDFREQFMLTYGREEYQSLMTWLTEIRDMNATDSRDRLFEKALQYTKAGVVMTGIGYRMSTVVKHGSAAALKSLGYLGNLEGAKYFKDAVAQMGTGHLSEMISWAKENIPEIRARMLQMDRDYKQGSRSMYEEEDWRAKNERFGHMFVAWSDALSAIPTAYAAYNLARVDGVPKSMGGTGEPMSEQEAVKYANSVVRQAHGTALETARSNFMLANRRVKGLFGAIYGFMNNTYGQIRDMSDKAFTDGSHWQNNPAIAARLFATVLIPALCTQWVKDYGPNAEEDEGWAHWIAKAIAGEVAATVPFVRDAVSMLEYDKADATVAPLRYLTDTYKVGKDVVKEFKGESSRIIQDLGNLVGELFHIGGLGQAGKSGQYIRDVLTGNVPEPANAGVAVRDVLLGHHKGEEQ